MAKRLIATEENKTKRNIKFLDLSLKQEFTRAQIVKEIEEGNYPEYHIRKINGLKTPVSNPDKKTSNNLD